MLARILARPAAARTALVARSLPGVSVRHFASKGAPVEMSDEAKEIAELVTRSHAA